MNFQNLDEIIPELNGMNHALAGSKVVMGWRAAEPDQFRGVDTSRLVAHVANIHERGGVRAVAAETGLRFLSVIHFLRCTG